MGILTNLSLFSGVGGLDLAAKWTGKIKTICYVENDAYCQAVLMSRFRSGELEAGPIWDDVCTFDGKPWRGTVDIISGGFPCQDLSVAGKRKGIKGSRSGLWFQFARIISEVGPSYILVENVPGLTFSGGIGAVLGSLAEMGYDAGWHTLSAASVGAPHLRERVWIVGWNTHRRNRNQGPLKKMEGRQNTQSTGVCTDVADSGSKGLSRATRKRIKIIHKTPETFKGSESSRGNAEKGKYWSVEPNVGRVAHGVAFRVDRIRCCGNGVVPQQALPAWEKIIEISKGL